MVVDSTKPKAKKVQALRQAVKAAKAKKLAAVHKSLHAAQSLAATLPALKKSHAAAERAFNDAKTAVSGASKSVEQVKKAGDAAMVKMAEDMLQVVANDPKAGKSVSSKFRAESPADAEDWAAQAHAASSRTRSARASRRSARASARRRRERRALAILSRLQSALQGF